MAHGARKLSRCSSEGNRKKCSFEGVCTSTKDAPIKPKTKAFVERMEQRNICLYLQPQGDMRNTQTHSFPLALLVHTSRSWLHCLTIAPNSSCLGFVDTFLLAASFHSCTMCDTNSPFLDKPPGTSLEASFLSSLYLPRHLAASS